MVNEERYQRIGRMRKAVQGQDYAALSSEADHLLITRVGWKGVTKDGSEVDLTQIGGHNAYAEEDKALRRVLAFAKAGQWEFAKPAFSQLYGAEPDPREEAAA